MEERSRSGATLVAMVEATASLLAAEQASASYHRTAAEHLLVEQERKEPSAVAVGHGHGRPLTGRWLRHDTRGTMYS